MAYLRFKILALIIVALLSGCNALGGIPPDAIANARNAAASCIRIKSLVMGDAVITTANDTKGAIINGSVTVNPETCAITINNAPAPPAPATK